MSHRRFLITIGSPECPGFHLPLLRRVAGDVQRITSFFTHSDQGYEHALATELPLGATARQIEDSLGAWFAHEDRRESDCVMVYVAGHGDSGDKFTDHYLLTADSEPRRANSALRTAELARWFFGGEGERPQNVLLILDVCYAGQGAGEAGAELVRAEARALRGGGAGFWVLATADPNSEAGDGAFVDALLEVMNDEAWVPCGGARYVSPETLSVAVNARYEHGQQSVVYGIGLGRVEPPFIRNPRFTRDLDGVSVADRAHWDPKARGVDVATMPGWFFTGRHQALRELSAWLQAERSDRCARVVTGGPGSGKSAVLGWLVLTARIETRQDMAASGLLADSSPAPPPGAVAARVHARGMRLHEMTATLAALLSSAARDPSSLIADLSSRAGPIGIVIDSLDEAAEPVPIERELLAELAICPSVRLIVGGRRRNGRPPLADVAVVVDLDAAGYFARADLTDYVFSRLTAPGAAYASEAGHAHARRIAGIVAERAGYSFLYARLVSRTLLQAAAPLDTDWAGWQAELKLPADLTDAFGADLDRFDRETRQRFVDLLVPLAYARGKGLPQKNVWVTVASHIAGRGFINADLRELKEKAGYYLVQDTESGEVVFRLFHQTFADYLRDLTRDEGVERSFAEALLSLVPRPPAEVEPWSQVGEPYLLDHFPSHAGAGGLLEEQLADPGFLLHVSPEALLPELHRAVSLEARRCARAYRRASHWIRNGDDEISFTYLLWGAYQHSAHGLAQRLEALRPRLPWFPEWAAWQPVLSGHVLGGADTAITALTVGEDGEGNPVAVCGDERGTIRVWNLATSGMLLELRQAEGPIKILALAECVGRNLIVGAWRSSIGVFDLQTGEEMGRSTGQKSADFIRALCVVPSGVGALLVTATEDFSLHVRQLPALDRIATQKKAAAAACYDLAPIELRGEPAVVSATDSHSSGEETEDRPVRVWRARDLDLLWFADSEDIHNGMEVRVCIVGQTTWIAARTLVGELTLLDPVSGERLEVLTAWEDRLTGMIGSLARDSGLLLLGHRHSRLCVLSLRPHADGEGRTIAAEEIPSGTEIRGDLWSEIVGLNGRPTLVSADDRQLRIWDVEELLQAPTAQEGGSNGDPFDPDGSSLAGVAADNTVIVTGSTGRGPSALRLWNAEGRLLWSRQFRDRLQNVALAEIDGSRVVLWVAGSGFVHLLSASDGTEIREPLRAGEDILAMSVRNVKGSPTVFLAVNLKRRGEQGHCVVRVWDLLTGEEIETSAPTLRYSGTGEREWRLEGLGYYSNKSLFCVDALEWGGSTIVAFAGPHGEVRAMGLESLEEVDRWEGGSMGDYVHSLVTEVCDGRPLAFGGDERGRLFARDLAKKQEVCPRLDEAHRGRIEALCIRQTPYGACLASGGVDGVVHLWTTNLTHLARIETERRVNGLAFVGSERLAVAADRGLTLLRLDWQLLFSRGGTRGALSSPWIPAV